MTVRLMFLFAVVRDVQRNRRRRGRRERDGSIVSIRCRARRTAEPALADPSDLIVPGKFLFAVVRDVQRNRSHGR